MAEVHKSLNTLDIGHKSKVIKHESVDIRHYIYI